MTKRQSIVEPVILSAVAVLAGGSGLRDIQLGAASWEPGFILGISTTLLVIAWASFALDRIVANYREIIGIYSQVVDALLEEPTP